MRRMIFVTSVLLLSPLPALAVDVIRMKNGDVYRGEIIKQEFGKKLQLRFKDGNEKSLLWKDIQATEKEPEPVAQPEASAPPAAVAPAEAPPPEAAAAPAEPAPPPPPPADPTPAPAPEEQKRRMWSSFVKLGGTVGNTSKYTVKDAGGTLLGNYDEKANGAWLWGVEFVGQFTKVFGLSFVIEGNKYNYKGSTPADTHTTFLAVPRLRTTNENVWFWGGFGLGLTATTLGADVLTSGIYTITLENNLVTFAASPRIGVDFQVAEKFVLGVEASYTATAGEIKGSVRNRTTNATAAFKEEVTRGWYGLALRAGGMF